MKGRIGTTGRAIPHRWNWLLGRSDCDTVATDPTGGNAGNRRRTVSRIGIFGTLTIPATATVGLESATVTNANGGLDDLHRSVNITPAPAITAPSVATPKPILDGTATVVTITGSGFVKWRCCHWRDRWHGQPLEPRLSNSANPAAFDKFTRFHGKAGNAGQPATRYYRYATAGQLLGSTPILDGLVVTNHWAAVP